MTRRQRLAQRLTRRVSSLVLTAALFTVVGCTRTEPPVAQNSAPLVEVTAVRMHQVRPRIETFGTLSHVAKVEVFPTTEARVQTISVEEGQRVATGQLLAQLDSRRIKIARDQTLALIASRRAAEALAFEQLREGRRAAEAQMILIEKASLELEQRRTEYDAVAELLGRRKQLHAIGGVAASEIDALQAQYQRSLTEKRQAANDLALRTIGYRDQDIHNAGLAIPASNAQRAAVLIELNTSTLRARLDVARAELLSAQAELRRIEVSLAETFVRSPIDGVVAGRAMDVGGQANPQTMLFALLDTTRLYVQTSIREEQLPLVALGNRAEVHVGRRLPLTVGGTVQLIAPYLDPGSRSARVRVLLDDHSGHQLLPGMFARVEIDTAVPQQAALVPLSALSRDHAQQEQVFLVRNGTLFSTPVSVVSNANGSVALHGDIHAGDRIVLNPRSTYHDGMQVTVLEDQR